MDKNDLIDCLEKVKEDLRLEYAISEEHDDLVRIDFASSVLDKIINALSKPTKKDE